MLPKEIMLEIADWHYCLLHPAAMPNAIKKPDYAALHTLCLVSKYFAECFTPELYFAIHTSRFPKKTSFGKLLRTLAAREDLRQHIQQITVVRSVTVKYNLSTMLQHVVFAGPPSARWDQWSGTALRFDAKRLRLLRYQMYGLAHTRTTNGDTWLITPTLDTLILGRVKFTERGVKFAGATLSSTVPMLQGTRLTQCLIELSMLTTDAFEQLLRTSPQLTHLYLFFVNCQCSGDRFDNAMTLESMGHVLRRYGQSLEAFGLYHSPARTPLQAAVLERERIGPLQSLRRLQTFVTLMLRLEFRALRCLEIAVDPEQLDLYAENLPTTVEGWLPAKYDRSRSRLFLAGLQSKVKTYSRTVAVSLKILCKRVVRSQTHDQHGQSPSTALSPVVDNGQHAQQFEPQYFLRLGHLPPEVLDLIGSFCDYDSRFNLCLVSRYFAAAFTPSLYRDISIEYVGGRRSLGRLMVTLATQPALAAHVHTLAMHTEVAFEGDVFAALLRSQSWVDIYYSSHFTQYFFSAVAKKPASSIDSLMAILVVLSPNLRTLTWRGSHESDLLMALFKYPYSAVLTDAPAMNNPLFSCLTDFEFLRNIRHNSDQHPHLVWKPELLQHFLHAPRMRSLRLEHLSCSTPFLGLELFRPAPTYYAMPLVTQLQSLHLSLGAIDVCFFREILARSPCLEDLRITSHRFSSPSLDEEGEDGPWKEKDGNRIMSVAGLGQALRDYGRSIRQLTVFHAHDMYDENSAHNHRGVLGSLRSMPRLELLCADPDMFIAPQADATYDQSRRLKNLLPCSLRCLYLTAREDFQRCVMRAGRELTSCLMDETLGNLVLVNFLCETEFMFRLCRQVVLVPAGWTYMAMPSPKATGTAWVRMEEVHNTLHLL
ncbi:hypothetical protein Micbo1qcDRAFT_179294 [Microdochium bolleyi]|uniref:Uncharacterized protein n=1 Tax=Microdochium bolleyi TaxID=196109 RepID=A0A136IQ53_9PEZI|nr:hypothetical protein Micbo1qcDRAFT_179294 [Microdochium bolleyi]